MLVLQYALASAGYFPSLKASYLKGLGKKEHPRVPCFVWWPKPLIISKVNQDQFVPTPQASLLMYLSTPQLVALWAYCRFLTLFSSLDFLEGVSVIGTVPINGLVCAL